MNACCPLCGSALELSALPEAPAFQCGECGALLRVSDTQLNRAQFIRRRRRETRRQALSRLAFGAVVGMALFLYPWQSVAWQGGPAGLWTAVGAATGGAAGLLPVLARARRHLALGLTFGAMALTTFAALVLVPWLRRGEAAFEELWYIGMFWAAVGGALTIVGFRRGAGPVPVAPVAAKVAP